MGRKLNHRSHKHKARGKLDELKNSEELEDSENYHEDIVHGFWRWEYLFTIVLVVYLAFMPFQYTNIKHIVGDGQHALEIQVNEMWMSGNEDGARQILSRVGAVTVMGNMYVANGWKDIDQEKALAHLYAYLAEETNFNLVMPVLMMAGDMEYERGNYEKAIDNFNSLLEHFNEHTGEAHFKIGNCMMQLNLHEHAIVHYENARNSTSDLKHMAKAHRGMGDAYQALHEYDQSIINYKFAVECDDESAEYVLLVAAAHYARGQVKKTSEVYLNAKGFSANAWKGEKSAWHRTPIDYVQTVFDEFTSLAEVGGAFRLNAPFSIAALCNLQSLSAFCVLNGLEKKNIATMMFNRIKTVLGTYEGIHWLDTLELGCGLGSAGAQFKSISNSLHCIEASSRSVRFANMFATGYNSISLGDFTNLTKYQDESMDLILAVDALPYLGDLYSIFASAYQILRRHGTFAFSVDYTEEVTQYHLTAPGRWYHSTKYIYQLAEKCGFEVLDTTNSIVQLEFILNDSYIIEQQRNDEKIMAIILLRKTNTTAIDVE